MSRAIDDRVSPFLTVWLAGGPSASITGPVAISLNTGAGGGGGGGGAVGGATGGAMAGLRQAEALGPVLRLGLPALRHGAPAADFRPPRRV